MTFEIELYASDYVLMKNGEPVDAINPPTIYWAKQESDLIRERELQEGETWVSMTELPTELQDKYREAIKYRWREN